MTGKSEAPEPGKTEPPVKLNIQSVTSALMQAQKAWEKFDRDKSGTLSLAEVTELLNRWVLREYALSKTLTERPLLRCLMADKVPRCVRPS